MKYREDYPLSIWIIDLRDILAKREYIEKKEAILLIVEDIDEYLDMYEGGMSPQEAYRETIE